MKHGFFHPNKGKQPFTRQCSGVFHVRIPVCPATFSCSPARVPYIYTLQSHERGKPPERPRTSNHGSGGSSLECLSQVVGPASPSKKWSVWSTSGIYCCVGERISGLLFIPEMAGAPGAKPRMGLPRIWHPKGIQRTFVLWGIPPNLGRFPWLPGHHSRGQGWACDNFLRETTFFKLK